MADGTRQAAWDRVLAAAAPLTPDPDVAALLEARRAQALELAMPSDLSSALEAKRTALQRIADGPRPRPGLRRIRDVRAAENLAALRLGGVLGHLEDINAPTVWEESPVSGALAAALLERLPSVSVRLTGTPRQLVAAALDVAEQHVDVGIRLGDEAPLEPRSLVLALSGDGARGRADALVAATSFGTLAPDQVATIVGQARAGGTSFLYVHAGAGMADRADARRRDAIVGAAAESYWLYEMPVLPMPWFATPQRPELRLMAQVGGDGKHGTKIPAKLAATHLVGWPRLRV